VRPEPELTRAPADVGGCFLLRSVVLASPGLGKVLGNRPGTEPSPSRAGARHSDGSECEPEPEPGKCGLMRSGALREFPRVLGSGFPAGRFPGMTVDECRPEMNGAAVA
jgi:hypothetical protein